MSVSLADFVGILESFISGQNQTLYDNIAQSQRLTLYKALQANNNALTINNQQNAVILQLLGQLLNLSQTQQATLLRQIGTPQQSGSEVTLPAEAPSGWPAQITAGVPSAVWEDTLPYSGEQKGANVRYTSDTIYGLNQNTVRVIAQNPLFYFYAQDAVTASWFTDYAILATLDQITASDTVLSWLEREAPSFTWKEGTADFEGMVWTEIQASPLEAIVCRLTVVDLEQVKLIRGLIPRGFNAPLWPGLGNATLGSSYSLSNGLVVPGPLTGLIVTITSVPTPVGYYAFGTHKSFVHVGAVVFEDDNGNLEQSQPLGLDTNVITPKSMYSASSATLRVISGVIGTVRAWSTNT